MGAHDGPEYALKLPTVLVPRRDAKAHIGERIKEGRRASVEFYEASSKPAERRYGTWDRRNYMFLAELFDTDEIALEYKGVAKFKLTGSYRSPERAEQHQKRIDRKVKWFKELERRIDNHFHEAGESPPSRSFSETISALEKVDLLCSRFHAVVDQLKQPKRRSKRGPRSSPKDEYDVQDVLHALLWIFFSDVRREDPVPQRAGAASRTDFVLKHEEIIVEVKKTRTTLRDNEVGKELIVDIERYKARKDCKLAYCFVYDPEHYIRNPAGLEELSRNDGDLAVKVVVMPKL
jgi:REase_DpnII-MboI